MYFTFSFCCLHELYCNMTYDHFYTVRSLTTAVAMPSSIFPFTTASLCEVSYVVWPFLLTYCSNAGWQIQKSIIQAVSGHLHYLFLPTVCQLAISINTSTCPNVHYLWNIRKIFVFPFGLKAQGENAAGLHILNALLVLLVLIQINVQHLGCFRYGFIPKIVRL